VWFGWLQWFRWWVRVTPGLTVPPSTGARTWRSGIGIPTSGSDGHRTTIGRPPTPEAQCQGRPAKCEEGRRHEKAQPNEHSGVSRGLALSDEGEPVLKGCGVGHGWRRAGTDRRRVEERLNGRLGAPSGPTSAADGGIRQRHYDGRDGDPGRNQRQDGKDRPDPEFNPLLRHRRSLPTHQTFGGQIRERRSPS